MEWGSLKLSVTFTASAPTEDRYSQGMRYMFRYIVSTSLAARNGVAYVFGAAGMVLAA